MNKLRAAIIVMCITNANGFISSAIETPNYIDVALAIICVFMAFYFLFKIEEVKKGNQ